MLSIYDNLIFALMYLLSAQLASAIEYGDYVPVKGRDTLA